MLSSVGQALAGACGRQLHRAVYCVVHLQGESAAHRRLTSILRDLRLDLAMHNHHAKLPARTPARRNRSKRRASSHVRASPRATDGTKKKHRVRTIQAVEVKKT